MKDMKRIKKIINRILGVFKKKTTFVYYINGRKIEIPKEGSMEITLEFPVPSSSETLFKLPELNFDDKDFEDFSFERLKHLNPHTIDFNNNIPKCTKDKEYLNWELNNAIENVDYEKAAGIRDIIDGLND